MITATDARLKALTAVGTLDKIRSEVIKGIDAAATLVIRR